MLANGLSSLLMYSGMTPRLIIRLAVSAPCLYRPAASAAKNLLYGIEQIFEQMFN